MRNIDPPAWRALPDRTVRCLPHNGNNVDRFPPRYGVYSQILFGGISTKRLDKRNDPPFSSHCTDYTNLQSTLRKPEPRYNYSLLAQKLPKPDVPGTPFGAPLWEQVHDRPRAQTTYFLYTSCTWVHPVIASGKAF